MRSVFSFHSFVIEDHHVASLAAAVQELEEGVIDLSMFKLMSWKLLREDGFACPSSVRPGLTLFPFVHSSSNVSSLVVIVGGKELV